MTRRILCVGLALMGISVARPMLCAAQTASGSPGEHLAADLKRDWEGQKERLLALAEAMPTEKYTFKATDPQRTFGEQLAHLAEAHVKMFQRLDPSSSVPVPTLSHEATKAQVVKNVEQAYDYGTAVLEAASATLLDQTKENTNARVVWQAMGNAQNHYGQCVVYLRLNDIVPPASRR